MWQNPADAQPVGPACSLSLPAGQRYVAVHLLTNQCLNFVVEVKARVCELLNTVVDYLAVKDSNLFGLSTFSDGEFLFLDPEVKLSKYAPKAWKSSRTGLNNQCQPLLVLSLRVLYYSEHLALLRNNIARHHYYLQLRENVIRQLPVDRSTDQYFVLASLALQADLGDYYSDTHDPPYFVPRDYFPSNVVEEVGLDYIYRRTPLLHEELRGLSRWEAELRFIKEAASSHNAHFYPLRARKEDAQASVLVGVSAKGLEIYEVKSSLVRSHAVTLPWSNISKLSFEKKKFEIRVAGEPDAQRSVYLAPSDSKAKHLLYLCRITHQYSLAALQELRRPPPERKESVRSDHRISLVSSISSNTTSGIVADKLQTTDDSEDDLEIEILLKCPPPTASLESLTLSDLEGRRDDPRSCKRSPKKTAEDTPTPRASTVPNQEEEEEGRGQQEEGEEEEDDDDDDDDETEFGGQHARCSLAEPHLYKTSFSDDEEEEASEAAPFQEEDVLPYCCDCPGCAISDSEDEGERKVHRLRGEEEANCFSHVPASSGTYPSRSSVSHTFDTDSDYVRVPYQSEAGALFINSRPEISVLTAHASDVPAPVRSYASPAVPYACGGGSSGSRVAGNPNVLGVPLPPVPDSSSSSSRGGGRCDVLIATAPAPSHAALSFGGLASQQQLEQYKQQLYSDVDYVIYPLKDPVISRQEYADARHLMAAAAAAAAAATVGLPAPPPYRPPRTDCAASRPPPPLPSCAAASGSSRYSSYSSSSLNLSSAPESAYCSPASSSADPYRQCLSASSLSLSGSSAASHVAYGYGYETASYSTGSEGTASSQSLAGSYDPIHREQQYCEIGPPRGGGASPPKEAQGQLNLTSLWEQSRALDLPLLAALCNDRSLLPVSSVPSDTPEPGRLIPASKVPPRSGPSGKHCERKCWKPVTLPKARNSYSINSPKKLPVPPVVAPRPLLPPKVPAFPQRGQLVNSNRWPPNREPRK